MKHQHVFLKAILAGMSIGIAGIIYLSIDNQIIGALFFTFGLLLILARGYYLYTGQIGYIQSKDLKQFAMLGKSLFGNMIGVAIMAYLVRLSGLEMIYDRGALLYADKISVTWYEVFFKAILCGFMVFIAVDAYRKASHVFFKFIMVVLPISIFIIAGFEHSIANMFYLFLGDHFSWTSLLYILIMVFGNSIGSIILFQLDQMASSKNQTS